MSDFQKQLLVAGGIALLGYAFAKIGQHRVQNTIAPLKKDVEAKQEQENFTGGGHHGGGGYHGGGGRGYVPYGVPYPVYYNPDALCQFVDKTGRRYTASCLGQYSVDLPNT